MAKWVDRLGDLIDARGVGSDNQSLGAIVRVLFSCVIDENRGFLFG